MLKLFKKYQLFPLKMLRMTTDQKTFSKTTCPTKTFKKRMTGVQMINDII